ncbi:MAG TPA: ferritin family protein [Sedimentisphaerales bacterium]|nr:ferritin family protein [Sedimentisphaerales bacterium]
MGISFTADEIFEMAEQIERSAAEYYREASRNSQGREIKQMLLDMSAMEEGHLETFEQMRKELSGREKEQMIFDPDNQGALYLQAMADSRGLEGRVSPTRKLTGNESIKEVLEIAIKAEKESVVFYLSLKELVPVRGGRDKVEKIIMEELSHINTLVNYLKDAA